MQKEAYVTNIQQARAIIKTVGKMHQYLVSDKLRSITSNTYLEHEKDAQKVIDHMEKEYVLNVANQLWADYYDEIPEYIKDYNSIGG